MNTVPTQGKKTHKGSDLGDLGALELSALIREKEISVTEVLDHVFAISDKMEEKLNCYITLDREGAYIQAEKVQEQINAGNVTGILAGVPVAVKDNICTKNLRTTCASGMLEGFVPPYDATVVERLRRAGCIITGKSNMDEFGMGNTTETSAFGPVHNPVDLIRSPGGSSGGSAAAVASGEAFIALGSDTGGSVRCPASHCGVTGFKPSYGRVSRYGLVAYASSMDQIGVLAKNIRDAQAMYSVIAGPDGRDACCIKDSDPAAGGLYTGNLKGVRVGLVRNLTDTHASDDVKKAVYEAADAFRQTGADVFETDMGYTEYATAAYYLIADAECSSNLARFDGVKYGYRSRGAYKDHFELTAMSRAEAFGPEVKRRIMAGCFVLSEGFYKDYYLRACRVRELIKREYCRLFETYDILLLPVASSPAPVLGGSDDVIRGYDADIFTIGANLAGLPAVSVPFGYADGHLPVGVQLCAGYKKEDILLKAAAGLAPYARYSDKQDPD